MGKAIPKGIKARANILLEKFPDSFSTDFEKNKQFVQSLELPLYKTNRNLIVGFITRQVKQKIKKAA
ncbi:MAG: 30S ribosomal protein S17e [Candidatus Diapherotrites archaeon]